MEEERKKGREGGGREEERMEGKAMINIDKKREKKIKRY